MGKKIHHFIEFLWLVLRIFFWKILWEKLECRTERTKQKKQSSIYISNDCRQEQKHGSMARLLCLLKLLRENRAPLCRTWRWKANLAVPRSVFVSDWIRTFFSDWSRVLKANIWIMLASELWFCAELWLHPAEFCDQKQQTHNHTNTHTHTKPLQTLLEVVSLGEHAWFSSWISSRVFFFFLSRKQIL